MGEFAISQHLLTAGRQLSEVGLFFHPFPISTSRTNTYESIEKVTFLKELSQEIDTGYWLIERYNIIRRKTCVIS